MTYTLLDPLANDDAVVFAALADIAGVWLPQHPALPRIPANVEAVFGSMSHDELMTGLASVLADPISTVVDARMADAVRRELARRHYASPSALVGTNDPNGTPMSSVAARIAPYGLSA